MSTVGIVGVGIVGSHIAEACAKSGYEVRVTDLDMARAFGIVHKLEEAGQIRAVDEIADFAGCDLLVEAVCEHRETKIDVLMTLAEIAGEAALLVTTTSSFTVTDLAAENAVRDRLVGVHVMPAAPRGRLAEIAAGEHTGKTAVERARGFVTDVGWIPLTVQDRPGRLTRRLLMPFLNQVIQAYDDGLAAATDIDRVVELGLGHRRGPLAVLDSTGLDDHLAATSHTYATTHDPALAPPPLLARMVAAGRRGDKTGAGFHAKEQQ